MPKQDSRIVEHSFLPQHEVNRINTFLTDVAGTLKLSGWDVGLAPEVGDEDCIAAIQIEQQRHVATISVCGDWLQRSDDVKVNALIHEVLHIAHHDLTSVIYHVLPEGGYVPEAAQSMLQEMVRLEAEKMCDFLAGMFGAHLAPMTRWKELKKKYPKPKEKKVKKSAADDEG